MPSIIERFFDHQIGYIYLKAADEIQANQAAIVAALAPIANQGASALKSVVSKFLSHSGATGVVINAILDQAIDALTADELALLQKDVPGFVAAAVAKLQAHGKEMLAA